jgi:DNA-binding CsgD family transcriptional regulator
MNELEAELVDAGPLTSREGEIAVCLVRCLSNKDIARALGISIRTVDAHITTVYTKLGLHSQSINTRCAAITLMIARGMVSLSIKSIVAILIFNSAQISDSAVRVKGVRSSSSLSRLRRIDEA